MNTHRLSCCEAHGVNCDQGRACPERKAAAFNRATEQFWSEESKDTPPMTQDDLADFFWLGVFFFAIFVIGIPLLLWLIRSPAGRYAVSQLF